MTAARYIEILASHNIHTYLHLHDTKKLESMTEQDVERFCTLLNELFEESKRSTEKEEHENGV